MLLLFLGKLLKEFLLLLRLKAFKHLEELNVLLLLLLLELGLFMRVHC